LVSAKGFVSGRQSVFVPENVPLMVLLDVLTIMAPGMTAGEHGPDAVIRKLPEKVIVVPDVAVCVRSNEDGKPDVVPVRLLPVC
jgi:hypothetical protein